MTTIHSRYKAPGFRTSSGILSSMSGLGVDSWAEGSVAAVTWARARLKGVGRKRTWRTDWSAAVGDLARSQRRG